MGTRRQLQVIQGDLRKPHTPQEPHEKQSPHQRVLIQGELRRLNPARQGPGCPDAAPTPSP